MSPTDGAADAGMDGATNNRKPKPRAVTTAVARRRRVRDNIRAWATNIDSFFRTADRVS
jgi:hypothetical protein